MTEPTEVAVDTDDGRVLVVADFQRRVAAFTDDMATQGIHVGINGRCAVDGEPWPCSSTDG